jgi:hypothetical protein
MMDINQTCDLIQTDLFSYDFKSCYYKLSESIYYDLEGIDKTNKAERNIALGKQQIDNPALQQFLADSADSLVDYYLFQNGILNDEVILKQRDGFIISRMLDDNKSMMKIDMREHINLMIIALDRQKYITVSRQGVSIRGMRNKYPGIEKVFDKFKKINLYNKKGLFKQLKRIKEDFFNEEDLDVFLIEKGDKKLLMTKRMGLIEAKTGDINPKSIDKQKYYDMYIRDFIDPIILYYF